VKSVFEPLSSLAFTQPQGDYDNPHYFYDQRPTPPTKTGQITNYWRLAQILSKYSLGPGVLGNELDYVTKVYCHDYFADESRFVRFPYGSTDSFLVFDGLEHEIEITETTSLLVNDPRFSTPPEVFQRFTGDYTQDGGGVMETINGTGSQYGGDVIPVVSILGGHIMTSETLSYSGYIGGQKTSYVIDPGCPVSVSVSLGAFDVLNNRTPVTITTGDFEGPMHTSSIIESVPETTRTLKITKIRNPQEVFVGYNWIGDKVFRYFFETQEATETIELTNPAFDIIEWIAIPFQSWSVTFS
jgi:hypothetical protein